MSSMTHRAAERHITVGVDTHKDVHVAVALDWLGARIGELHLPTTPAGYADLERWAAGLGAVEAFGIEGTGCYGAGLARYLDGLGHRIVEVNRPDRATRYRLGKAIHRCRDGGSLGPLGTAVGIPKRADGSVEMIRMLKVARASAVKARTQSLDQIKALLVTAPAELRESVRGLSTRACSTVVPRSVPVCSTHRRRQRRSRCAAWPVATSRSGTRQRSWTWGSGGSWPARRPGCSPRSAWVLTVRRPSSSAPGTTPRGCVPRPPSPPSVDQARSRPRRARRRDTASTAAGTVKPTPPCTAWSWSVFAGTSPPRPTWPAAPPRARRKPRSCVA